MTVIIALVVMLTNDNKNNVIADYYITATLNIFKQSVVSNDNSINNA